MHTKLKAAPVAAFLCPGVYVAGAQKKFQRSLANPVPLVYLQPDYPTIYLKNCLHEIRVEKTLDPQQGNHLPQPFL